MFFHVSRIVLLAPHLHVAYKNDHANFNVPSGLLTDRVAAQAPVHDYSFGFFGTIKKLPRLIGYALLKFYLVIITHPSRSLSVSLYLLQDIFLRCCKVIFILFLCVYDSDKPWNAFFLETCRRFVVCKTMRNLYHFHCWVGAKMRQDLLHTIHYKVTDINHIYAAMAQDSFGG